MENELLNILKMPVQIGNLMLKNRLAFLPVPTGLVTDGILDERNIEFYKLRAKNAGMIVAGAINIQHPTATNNINIPNLHSTIEKKRWQQITNAVHQEDTKIFAEIWHSGSSRFFGDPELARTVTSPSGKFGSQKIGKEASIQEIEEIISQFAESAVTAKKIGFDGIELHAAHGSLLYDFISPLTNLRSDDYGLLNDYYFITQILTACRSSVGDDFPISLRISNFNPYDLNNKLFSTPEKLDIFLKSLKKYNLCFIDCSSLNIMEPAFENRKDNLSTWVKKLSNMPTIATGSITSHTPFLAELKAIIERMTDSPSLAYTDFINNNYAFENADFILSGFREQNFDLLGLGRALLFDPDWIEKVGMNK